MVSGNLLKESTKASGKNKSDDNNNEINKDSIDRSSGYYDQFTIRRGASMQQKESFNPATECRCIATRTGDRTCPTKIKEWESRCWRIREKKGPGPAILDLPGPPSWRRSQKHDEEDLFPKDDGTGGSRPYLGQEQPGKAPMEGGTSGGRLEPEDWRKVTAVFDHNWPRKLLPKMHPLERHFGIKATPPNHLKGPAVEGYATCYQKATRDLVFTHNLPEHPHLREDQKGKVVNVRDGASKIRASELFKKALKVNKLPAISLDTEQQLGESQVSLVVIMLETGFVLVYWLEKFDWNVRHALGFWIVEYMEGHEGRRVIVAGQDVRNDLEKLGIWVAHPLEVGPLVSRWYRRGNIRNFYSPTTRVGLKTVAYLINGETHLVVHPGSKKGMARERRDVLNRYLTDICRDRKKIHPDGSVEEWTELMASRNMVLMYKWEYPLKNYQVMYLGEDGGDPLKTLNVEIMLLYMTGGYNDWDRARMTQEVVKQAGRLHMHPEFYKFEEEMDWDEAPGPPREEDELDLFAPPSRVEASRPTLGQESQTEEEESDTPTEDEDLGECSERESFVRAAIRMYKVDKGKFDITTARFQATKYHNIEQRKDKIRKWAKSAGMYKGQSLNLVGNYAGVDANRCKTCGVAPEKCDCVPAAIRCVYPLCTGKRHQIGICPTLHGECEECSLRGHVTGDCRPGKKRKEKLLAIFFHWRMYGRMTMLFPEHVAVGPYVFRRPEDATEALVLKEIHWDNLDTLEENFTNDGRAKPQALERAKEERDRLLAAVLTTREQETKRSKNRKRRDRRKRIGAKARVKVRQRIAEGALPWEEEFRAKEAARKAREEKLRETRRRIDEWARAPSPPRDDEPNLAAQFPRYEG